MKKQKLFFKFLLLLIIISNNSFGQEKIEIISENKELKNTYNIDDFYFVHQIFADAFYMTDLYKQIDYDEMNNILKNILYKVDKNNKVTILVHQKEKFEAKLVFSIVEKSNDKILLTMTTNFESKSRTFTKEADNNSFARWYFIKNGKLVYHKDLYSLENENEKIASQDKIELIDYYLFDDNFENDNKVKPLIDGIFENKNSNKVDFLYANLYLVEYYLFNSDLKSAESSLNNLKKYFEENKDDKIVSGYQLFPKMAETEFELMKRITKQ